jgi:hypothetical protein
MIVFLRSIHAAVDSRLMRYVQALDRAGKDSLVLHWPRGGNAKLVDDEARRVAFSLEANLGGGWKNAFGLLKWTFWCFLTLVRNRKSIKIVHAVDLDTALPALLFSKLFGKKFVFDIYDSYGDARSISGVARKVVDMVEGFAARCAAEVILPDTCRTSQVPATVKNLRIIENVPFNLGAECCYGLSSHSDCIKLAYVGILEEEHRGLEDLLSAVARFPDKVELHVGGFGPLAGVCERMMQAHRNIHFHGALAPEQAIGLMAKCDVVIGMYYRTKPHHWRATPNKYYEHLLLGKPLVTTAGTPPGVKVTENQSGWPIREGLASIAALLEGITKEECAALGKNARQKWVEQYSRYFDEVLIKEYANEICKV